MWANSFILSGKPFKYKLLAAGERDKERNVPVWGDGVAKSQLLPLSLKWLHLDMKESFVAFL